MDFEDHDPRQLYEELHVHHIELELQNLQLQATQQELERSRDRYRRLYDDAPMGYLTLSATGMVLAANLTAARLLGLERAALVGGPLSRMMDSSSADLLHVHLQHVIRDQTSHGCELGLIRADGQRIWIHLESAPSDEHDGGPPACHTVFSDVSERRKLEAKVQRSERLEAIGRLASGVAHEFNNLLMAMLGCAASALIDIDKDSRAAELLRDLKAEAVRGATLTRQLLALGRPREDTEAVVDINAMIAQNERLLRHTLDADIDLVFRLEANDGRVWANQMQIEQVLTNLVVNARDAVSGAGRIEVITGELIVDDVLARKLDVRPGAYASLTVRDTGKGMDAATKARLFEPFFTTKAVGEGTGLGLSTVYGIVRNAGGHIDIESEPGAGTTVRVMLPRTTKPLPSPDEPAHITAFGGKETVLLVEDEPLVRQTVGHYLTRWGYCVIEADNGTQALAIIKARADIELLLTDMVLPELSGSGLAHAASLLRPDMRVLFMSAYPKVKLVRERRLNPDAPALQKPFTEDTLLAKVREVLDASGSSAPGKGEQLEPPAGERVLLVEDERLAREATQLLLEDEGYKVFAAADGAEAAALAHQHGETIDVVVTDLGLPNMPTASPTELIDGLVELVQPRAVVILSGRSSTDPEVRKLLRAPNTVFLEKPIEIEDLVAAIQGLLA
ncbi:Blue-light-activated protein [Enhygromyxa salina]|uniref:histidine kinase n=2 Tax=Enhygromyxa salina TaxID=215803 RepID=A0A2S9YBR8_9BACT|nr:Blue-light-activated protein [Enhygromyxa salina]